MVARRSNQVAPRSKTQVLTKFEVRIAGVGWWCGREQCANIVQSGSELSKCCLIVALTGLLLRSLRRTVSRSFAAAVTASTALVPGKTRDLGCQDSASVTRVLQVLGIKTV
jgi:hypothetical protein